jgi:LacI family transcriptional regulator
MKKVKNPRIKDIARLAKVSIGTVDRVLHNRGRVSEPTRQRVKEIVMQLSYKPNIIARTLVKNKKYTIGLLIPNLKEDDYWKQAFQGVQNFMSKCEQQGLFINIYFYSSQNKKSFLDIGQKVLRNKPDGIIMTPIFLNESLLFYKKCCDLGIPIIMYNTIIPNINPLSFIGIDSYRSGRVAAELLNLTALDNGKCVIMHFDEELVNAPHMLERERGFTSYLKEMCPGKKFSVKVLNNKKHYYQKELEEIFNDNDISCIFVSTAKTYQVGSYLQYNQIHGITLIGYDLTKKNIKLLNKGYISFLIHQNPSQQVEQSINLFCDHLIYNEHINPKILFPIEIITPTNLGTYLNRLSVKI